MFNSTLTSNHEVLISQSDRPSDALTNLGFGKWSARHILIISCFIAWQSSNALRVHKSLGIPANNENEHKYVNLQEMTLPSDPIKVMGGGDRWNK